MLNILNSDYGRRGDCGDEMIIMVEEVVGRWCW
jgi:hypothetical protein